MERATPIDYFDVLKIVIIYVARDDSGRIGYSIRRNHMTDLDMLLAEERRIEIAGVFSGVDNLIRVQYDDMFRWIEDLNENTPDILESCKFIIVGTEADVNTTLNAIRDIVDTIIQANNRV
ncbi:hypothetical protein GGI19_002760 [Coemansia pectinata]|uniref:Uncharacterized protein n=1 Tax=Coemansia pectinata TaxID=1052879 RepID=A0A9W8GWQ0_9FUNG|nr:hypothetical protein GGI19_002760 [Coemansia pectinata]